MKRVIIFSLPFFTFFNARNPINKFDKFCILCGKKILAHTLKSAWLKAPWLPFVPQG